MEAVTRFKSFSALFILMSAALIAQSGTMPEWGENRLSCGFTHALRTIKSVETVAAAILASSDRGDTAHYD
jgi:hypothetical protein